MGQHQHNQLAQLACGSIDITHQSGGSVSVAQANVNDDGTVTGDYWPTAGYSGGLYNTTPATGLVVNEREAMACSTAYACTRAIAETIGSLPALLYETISDGNRAKRRDHDAWSLLHDEPNPRMDSMQFYELATTRMVNRGNFFAEIERDNNDRPIALWPIHNSRVMPRLNDAGGLEWRVAYSEKDDGSGNVQAGKVAIIPDRDMFNLVGFGGLDGTGVISNGVLPRATEDLSLDIAMQQYGAKFFGTGGKPSGIVEMDQWIKDVNARRTLREDINRVHSGIEGWNQIGVLWGGKWKDISAAPEQAQFVESRGYQSKTICRWYNVPPAVVQIFDDYKFSTVDAMIRQFVLTCIRSVAVRWERAIRRQVLQRRNQRTGLLVPAFGSDDLLLEFALDALLRGDPKQQAEVNEIKWRSGRMSADEWRAQENENPLPRGLGKNYMVPSNFTTLDRAAAGDNLRSSGGGGGSNGGGSSGSESLPTFNKSLVVDVLKDAKDQRQVARGIGAEFEGTGAEDASQEAQGEVSASAMSYPEQVVADGFKRLLRVEMTALRRIVSRVESAEAAAAELPKQATRFYASHAAKLADAILIGVAGMVAESQTKNVAGSVAGRYCGQRIADEVQAACGIETDEALAAWQESTGVPVDESTADAMTEGFVEMLRAEIKQTQGASQ